LRYIRASLSPRSYKFGIYCSVAFSCGCTGEKSEWDRCCHSTRHLRFVARFHNSTRRICAFIHSLVFKFTLASPQTIGFVEARSQIDITSSLLPLAPGIHKISGLRISSTDASMKLQVDFDNMHDILVYKADAEGVEALN
jgi:hypothetical protein